MTKSQTPNPKSRSLVIDHWPLIVVSLGLAAIAPWFKLQAVCSDDLSLHLLRAIQLESLLRQGVLFSRWAPDMVFGYGCPLFGVFTPLSYYVVAAVGLLGVGVQKATLLTFALAMVGAGLAAYWLARLHLSPRGALVVAVAYTFAPYLGYDAFFRGNLGETLGWVFPPLAMGAIGRLAQRGGRRYLAATALAVAAIMVTHNVFALAFGPLLAAYALLSAFTLAPAPLRRRRAIIAGAALLLGMGVAAFFWLPATLERTYVHMERLLLPPDFIYWSNFIDLRELLAAPRVVHPDLLNPSPARGLGLLPVLLGLPAIAGLWRLRDKPRRALILFFLLALVAYAWLTTASSRLAWDILPLLKYTHFPWRLLGPAALCLAMLAGATAELLPAGKRGAILTGGIISILALGGLFWHTPRYCPWEETFNTVESIHTFARATGLVCTTSKGEYLPHTVEAIPAGAATTPLDPASLPPGTIVAEREALPIGAELDITATRPFSAVYNSFAYPGWQVTVDGAAATITPDAPYGRITFPVPGGRHHISVRFVETPLRRAADYLSLVCLAAAVGLWLWPGRNEHSTPLSGDRLSLAWGGWGLLLLGIVLSLQRVNTPLRNPGLRDGTLAGVDVTNNAQFEGELTLLGFNQERGTVPSGERVRLDLFWTAREPPTRRYQATIALVGPEGLHWEHPGSLPPRDFRRPPDTRLWPVGSYAQDSHYVETLPGTPPGVYDLVLTLFDRDTLAPLSLLNEQGQPTAPTLVLGQVTVTRPRRPADLPQENRVDLRMMDFTLATASFDRAQAAPGDTVYLTTMWQVVRDGNNGPSSRQCHQTVLLLSEDGSVAASYPLSLPVQSWQEGEVWRNQQRLLLPAALESGSYTWAAEWCSLGSHPVGQISIAAPPHTFTAPPVDIEIETRLGDLATLVGADIQSSSSLTVTLVWRAEAETGDSYHVFLHLVGPDGALAAQSDGIPAGWERPTTGWLAGEYVSDVHTLPLPADPLPGNYTLLAGLYKPNGPRLLAPDGRDALQITTIEMARQ